MCRHSPPGRVPRNRFEVEIRVVTEQRKPKPASPCRLAVTPAAVTASPSQNRNNVSTEVERQIRVATGNFHLNGRGQILVLHRQLRRARLEWSHNSRAVDRCHVGICDFKRRLASHIAGESTSTHADNDLLPTIPSRQLNCLWIDCQRSGCLNGGHQKRGQQERRKKPVAEWHERLLIGWERSTTDGGISSVRFPRPECKIEAANRQVTSAAALGRPET